MRFLVVDDDFYCRELLKAVFSVYGSCDLAIDGSEGLSLFRRALEDYLPYDVIFLDVIMPGLSGLETLDCIRQIERNYNIHGSERVKIVVITGFNDPKLSVRNFQKDCESYLAKPFTPLQVLNMIEEISTDFHPLPSRN